MKIVAILPMRHSSERVVGKNYRNLGDKPLFHHILDTLLAVPEMSQVVIDTDSPTIKAQVREKYGAVRVLDRPEHLRDGNTAMNDVLLNTTRIVEADLYLQTHSTNPFIRPETIQRSIDLLLRSEHADSLFGVTRLQARLWRPDGTAINHDPDRLARTQDLEPVYLENSCIYLFDRPTLVRRGNRVGDHPVLFEIDGWEALDIDDETDFQLAEAMWTMRS
jgi:CMP-N-acetylneuraminic acid synthetase